MTSEYKRLCKLLETWLTSSSGLILPKTFADGHLPRTLNESIKLCYGGSKQDLIFDDSEMIDVNQVRDEDRECRSDCEMLMNNAFDSSIQNYEKRKIVKAKRNRIRTKHHDTYYKFRAEKGFQLAFYNVEEHEDFIKMEFQKHQKEKEKIVSSERQESKATHKFDNFLTSLIGHGMLAPQDELDAINDDLELS